MEMSKLNLYPHYDNGTLSKIRLESEVFEKEKELQSLINENKVLKDENACLKKTVSLLEDRIVYIKDDFIKTEKYNRLLNREEDEAKPKKTSKKLAVFLTSLFWIAVGTISIFASYYYNLIELKFKF